MKNKKVFQTHMYQDFDWSTSLVDRADAKQHCALMISRPKKQKDIIIHKFLSCSEKKYWE